jgi:4-hydroxy-3-methylbut-2-enyl diphosphate reductase
MCFGVRDAIDLALQQSRQAPLTIFGELVHNKTVLDSLRQRGIGFERQAGAIPTEDVMITAHGASDKAIASLKEHGLRVIEATCPLVHFVHQSLRRLIGDGFHPVVIGKRDHVEVRGLTEDLTECDILLTEADVLALRERPRFGVVAQTTQPIDRVRQLANLIRNRFPNSEVRFIDTVCQPTKQRQTAAVELAQASDIVIVIGGAESNNTRELIATCSRHCPQVHHVETPDDLHAGWLENAGTVGLTAGTSTPDSVIDAVERRIRQFVSARVPALTAVG